MWKLVLLSRRRPVEEGGKVHSLAFEGGCCSGKWLRAKTLVQDFRFNVLSWFSRKPCKEESERKQNTWLGMSGRILMHVQAPGRDDDDEESVKLSWVCITWFWGLPGSSDSCYQNYKKAIFKNRHLENSLKMLKTTISFSLKYWKLQKSNCKPLKPETIFQIPIKRQVDGSGQNVQVFKIS